MIITSPKIDYMRDLYDAAKNARQAIIDDMVKAQLQYDGDNSIDGSSEKASYVRNITKELIESQVDTNIPMPKVSPRSQSEKGTRNAQAVERLIKSVRDLLPFEMINDADDRNTYIYGGSVWLVEWDESVTTHNTAGEVKISIIKPDDFFPQPNVASISDMDYVFLRYVATREDIKRRYNITDTDGAELDPDHLNSTEDEETCTIYVCYYKDEKDCVCRFSWSGDIVLEDITDYYARKVKVCRKCHRKESICTCDKPNLEMLSDDYEVLHKDIVLSDGTGIPAESPVINDDGTPKTKTVKQPVMTETGDLMLDGNGEPVLQDAPMAVMQPTKIPYYKPKMLPVVVRKNISSNTDVMGQSDCLAIREQQQAINKVESRIMRKLMQSGITPYMPEDARIIMDNSIFGQILKLQPNHNQAMYGTIDTTPNIVNDIAEADRLYDHAKRILGISDSYQGQYDASAQSGRAKQIQVAQAMGRLESKRRMKQSAYADIDRIIFEYYLAYADEPRPVAYRDRFGNIQNAEFNRYAFVQYDEERGEWYYDDRYLFSADTSSIAYDDKDTMMQSNINLWQSGAFGVPQDPATMVLFWQAMERIHYPNASEMVDYFNSIKQSQEAQAQQQIQQGGMIQ